MIYKYFFYSVSYVTQKYDHLYRVGDQYYIGGGMLVGMTIAISIISIIEVIGILFYHPLLTLHMKYTAYFPLILGLAVTIYLGKGGRYKRIYEEVKNLNPIRKKRYKILNLIHIFFVWGLFFTLSNIIRVLLGNA